MALIGSFAGAAFAFAFFLIGLTLQRAYERRSLHYNSLVRLERMLNIQLDQVHLIPIQVTEMIEPIAKGSVVVAIPRPILELDDLFIDLLDLDLTNALIEHRVSVQRVNDDIRNLREAYVAVKDRYLDGDFDDETYVSSGNFLVSKYSELAQAMTTMESELLSLLAQIRLRIAEPRPMSFRLAGRLSRLKLRPLSDSEISRERTALEVECSSGRNPYSAA